MSRVSKAARLLGVAATKVADPKIKDALTVASKVIGEHTQKATAKIEAEMIPDPFNPPFYD